MEVQIFGIKKSADTRAALLSDERWLEKLSLEPLLLRMPLVRYQQQLTIGPAQETWSAWYAASKP